MGGGKLSKAAQSQIEKAKTVYVSSISSFEIAHAASRGSLELPCEPDAWFYDALEKHDLSEIHLSGKIAAASVKLPRIHKDPCDRFIIATAKLTGLAVVTGDHIFKEYDIPTLS